MKAVIFNLDGTLLDVSESMFWQYEALTREFNGVQASRDAIAVALKHDDPTTGLRHLVTNMRVPFDRVEQRRDELRAASLQHLRLYPHVEELLKILHNLGVRVAVLATDSDDVSGHLERLRLAPLVTTVITNEQLRNSTPHPEAVNAALRHLDVLPHEAMLVGDLPDDITAGNAAALQATIGITHGFGMSHDLKAAGANHIVHNVPSVLDVLG